MARLALPAGWAGALTRQRGPLRTYQWLWLLLCTLGALVVAAPRILSQPLIYTTTAAARIDGARRYRELFNAGPEDPDFLAVREIALELLHAQYPELGSPRLGVRFEPRGGGAFEVVAVGRSPGEAQSLADAGAEALARSARARPAAVRSCAS